MRSRADLRIAAEWMARALLIGALALALWRSVHAGQAERVTLSADARGLPSALARATSSPLVRGLAVTIDSMPGGVERAWLAALRRAGVTVAWRGMVPGIAIAAEPTREPNARVRVLIAERVSGDSWALADSAGALDSLRIEDGGAAAEVQALVGSVRAVAGRFAAVARAPDHEHRTRRMRVGRAGWESKFVAAALQESGWLVRSRQSVAPGVVVADAGILPIDTTRFSVVVALDSTAAALAPVVVRFVAQGGGLVLAGAAPALRGFAAIAPAQTGPRQPGRILLDRDSLTRGDLPFRPLDVVRGDAVRLEGTASAPRTVVRRAGLGRVLTIAWDETWRWRMLGGATGQTAHRDWWSHTVALVAAVGDSGVAGGSDAVDALGPSTPAVADARITLPGESLPIVLLALLVVLLLAETASRRFRGAS
jgi:hypothetical protein